MPTFGDSIKGDGFYDRLLCEFHMINLNYN